MRDALSNEYSRYPQLLFFLYGSGFGWECKSIQGAWDLEQFGAADVGIDLGRTGAAMAEEFLDIADIDAGFQ